MSFIAPVILIVAVLGLLIFGGYVPGCLELSQSAMQYFTQFLAVFGDGSVLQGIVTLGITVSIAGILLDILNFYRYQSLRD